MLYVSRSDSSTLFIQHVSSPALPATRDAAVRNDKWYLHVCGLQTLFIQRSSLICMVRNITILQSLAFQRSSLISVVRIITGVAHLATLYKVASWTDAWGMFVMGKLVFQHVYMNAIEHGHDVQPDAAGFGVTDPSGFGVDQFGSGSGALPYDPFPRPGTYTSTQ